MRKAFFLVLMATMASVVGVCKCANVIIYLKGHVSGGNTDGLEIVAKTTPDANWEPQPEISVEHGAFEGEVYFDRTIASNQRFRDICTRVPRSIEIKLFKGGRQLGSIRLDISKDFAIDKFGDYKLRSPVEFHLR